MPKILDPIPVIADANQLLRHSLHEQIVTLCYLFFLHTSRVFACRFYVLYYNILAFYKPIYKFINLHFSRNPHFI